MAVAETYTRIYQTVVLDNKQIAGRGGHKDNVRLKIQESEAQRRPASPREAIRV